MEDAFFLLSETRAALAVAGEDRQAFLQGLISNDTRRIAPDRALAAAFLTPQGKYQFDMLLVEQGERYLLDVEAARRADLAKKLSMYRLRSKVSVADVSAEWVVMTAWGGDALEKLGLVAEPGAAKPFGGGVVFADPRLAALGARGFLPRSTAEASLREAGLASGDPAAYRALRIRLGVPEGSGELLPDKAILLENGFDELNAIDWQKGCYMGQELTARTRYRGLVRKRLFPVTIEGPAPEAGTPLMLGAVEAGEMRSGGADGLGLASIRLEHLDAAQRDGLTAGEARLRPSVPGWMKLPAAVE